MLTRITYDEIKLPEKVSDILAHDFWMLRHVPTLMVMAVNNPVKFSASTSIFVHQGSCEAEINLLKYNIQGPCIVNVGAEGIIEPKNVSADFDASFIVSSKRLTEAFAAHINDLGLFSLIRSHPVIKISEEEKTLLDNFYDNMQHIIDDEKNRHPFETILYTLLSFFFQNAYHHYDDFILGLPKSLNNHIADRFLQLVQQYFRTERFLEYYADKLEITPKHLSRTVKAQTGYSAVEWINRFVILEAKVLLRTSTLNIQQISEELHFPSQSFFGKYFKKATGMSPKDFRNSFS